MGFQMQSKVRFITIGYIERRKGQDLLIDAIELLSKDIKENAEFILIGDNTSHLAFEIANRIKDFNYIKMIGSVSRDEIHRFLDNSDIMICPSREDPMPTGCAEAMMHKVPCLVSDAIGTAACIKNEYDGLIFKREDVNDLYNKIKWCINNKSKIRKMGEKSFEIYKRYFSQNVFETNLLKYVEEMV